SSNLARSEHSLSKTVGQAFGICPVGPACREQSVAERRSHSTGGRLAPASALSLSTRILEDKCFRISPRSKIFASSLPTCSMLLDGYRSFPRFPKLTTI